ncbi:hypothetical protein [Myxosarcina sp. GI1(2024)]
MKLTTRLNKYQQAAANRRTTYTKNVIANSSGDVRLNTMLGLVYEQVWIPDLMFTTAGGKIVLVSVIDRMNADTRNKLLAIEKRKKDILNNMTMGRDAKRDTDYRLLFRNASRRVRKDGTMSYGQFAEQHGFRYAEGEEIPLEWLIED